MTGREIRKDAEPQLRRTKHGSHNNGKASANPKSISKEPKGDATTDADAKDVTGHGDRTGGDASRARG